MPSKLSRKSGARQRVITNLATSLILYEKITTTLTKAKRVKPYVEKIFTEVKKNNLASKRNISTKLSDKKAIKKLFDIALNNIKNISSGFVSIYQSEPRKGDGSLMSIVKINENIFKVEIVKNKKSKK